MITANNPLLVFGLGLISTLTDNVSSTVFHCRHKEEDVSDPSCDGIGNVVLTSLGTKLIIFCNLSDSGNAFRIS